MRLQEDTEHPHGLSDRDFDMIFTRDKPVIFAYHGYPWLIHRLTYRRTGHHNLHVRGYKEEGTTTTPFDMVMLNDLDRFHLVMDVIDRVPFLQSTVRDAAPADGRQAASRPASTPAPTATTSPRCATGCGPARAAPAGRTRRATALHRRRQRVASVDLGLSLGIFKGELVLPPSRCSLYYVAHWKLIGLPWKFFLIDSRMKALDSLDLGSLINKGGHS